MTRILLVLGVLNSIHKHGLGEERLSPFASRVLRSLQTKAAGPILILIFGTLGWLASPSHTWLRFP